MTFCYYTAGIATRPLGMHLGNLAYSKQAGSSPLKYCKSTARQESPTQCASDAIHIRPVSNGSFTLEITILDLMSDLAAAAAIFLPMMFNMTGVTGMLAVPLSVFFRFARLVVWPTQPDNIPHVMQLLPS